MAPHAVYDPSKDAKYKQVKSGDIASLEIFPPVGIARFGDSEDEYFFGPEVPGCTDTPTKDGNFRDPKYRIRRQAARFRVYAYDSNGSLLGEVNSKNGYTLKWKVHIANKKPANTVFRGRFKPPKEERRNPDVDSDVPLDERYKLIVDPKIQEICQRSGPQDVKLSGVFYGSKPDPTPVYLGELLVDDAGRLVFLGGRGHSQSIAEAGKPQPEIISEFDSTDWVDDACDGWVGVNVEGPDFSKSSSHLATVLCAPPKFAWGLCLPTNLYDIMENIYWENRSKGKDVEVDFYTHIWPVLFSACSLSWVNNKALEGHGPFGKGDFLTLLDDLTSTEENDLKDQIFGRLRMPDYKNPDQAIPTYMPRLSGDAGDLVEPGQISEGTQPILRFAALTQLQYDRFKKWKEGKFTNTKPSPATKIEDVTLSDQPRYLTRASLEQTVGDPLYPGIEMYWIAKLNGTYDFSVTLDPPFRVDHNTIQPGHLTRGLSLPWQADFDECNTHWWPSVRPDNVVTKADFENAMRGFGTQEENFAIATTTRRNWARYLRDTPSDYSSFPGSTDMVRFWNHLGFVKKYQKYCDINPNVFLESERRQLPDPLTGVTALRTVHPEPK